ncbi:MAG TPA: zinc-binding dehydrogenase, partial [Gemmatimonadaceae bacterium]|nr:zinc-binding dehydrogenase [Gemmatimonadaceae bacterium]
MQIGERLLIHAAGSGVGTAAIQLAKKRGIRTIGTSRTAAKLAKATGLGLESSIDSSSEDWADRVLSISPGGVDAVLDLVGGSYLAGNMKVVVSRGRIILVGLTGGRTQEIQLGVMLHKRLHIFGTVLRSRSTDEKISLAEEFAERILPSFDDGSLVPVIDRVMPFTEIRRAHDVMESNDTFGKIVLSWT